MNNKISIGAIVSALRKVSEKLDILNVKAEKKRLLSGSTDGKQIKVVATATPGTLIHTAQTSITPGEYDEIYLYAVNSSGASVKLTIEWGTATAPDGNIEITIPAEAGYTLVVPGLLLQNGMTVKAFAGTANVILINGYIKKLN